MLRTGVVVVALVAAACGTSSPAAPPTDTARAAAWRDDLKFLVTMSERHPRPFFHVAEATWRADVGKLDAAIPTLDDAHVIAAMVRLVASLGDSHTRLFFSRDKLYPVELLGFDDGLFVAGAGSDAAWAIGKRVTAIDGKPIAAALAALTPLVAAENPAFLAGALPQLFDQPLAIAGTDLAPVDRATLTVADGAATRDLAVTAGRGVAIAAPRAKPLHLDGPTQLAYWNKYVDAQHLLYLQYNACADQPNGEPFAKFAAGTLAFADQHVVDRFVIDLRSNEGGNSQIIQPLIDGIAARPALAGRVFALIGRTTFSSGVLAATALRATVHARLVGGPTGGNPNGYGEIKVFKLPSSHLVGQYSTKLFADTTFTGNTVPPDIEVHVVADDWFSGRDPAMDAVLAAPVPAAR